MQMRCLFALLAASLALGFLACVERTPSRDKGPKVGPEQDLNITFGGFMQNGLQDQLLDGHCASDTTRNVLKCDIHNGLMGWRITEVTFQVIRAGDNQQHFYREQVSIAPLQPEHVDIRLAMDLPPDSQFKVHGQPYGKPQSHWSWLIVRALGKPAK